MGKRENKDSVKTISYKKTDDSQFPPLKLGDSKGEKHNTSTLKKGRNDVTQSNTNRLKYNTLPPGSSIAQEDGSDTVSLRKNDTNLMKNLRKKVISSFRSKKKYNASINSVNVNENSSVKNAHITVDQSEVNGEKPKPSSSTNSKLRSDHEISLENSVNQTNGNNTLPIRNRLFKIDRHEKINILPLTCADNNGNSSNKKEDKKPQPKPRASVINNNQLLHKTNTLSNFPAYDNYGLNQSSLKKNRWQYNFDNLEWPDSTSNLKKLKSSENTNLQLSVIDNKAPPKPPRSFTTNNQFNKPAKTQFNSNFSQSIKDLSLPKKSDNSPRRSFSEEAIYSDSRDKNIITLDIYIEFFKKISTKCNEYLAKNNLSLIISQTNNNQNFNTSGNKNFNHKNKGNNMYQQTTDNKQNMTPNSENIENTNYTESTSSTFEDRTNSNSNSQPSTSKISDNYITDTSNSTEEDEKREQIQSTNPFGDYNSDSETDSRHNISFTPSQISSTDNNGPFKTSLNITTKNTELKRSASADTIYDLPWDGKKIIKNIQAQLKSQSNTTYTISTSGSTTPLILSEKTNKFCPRAKYAMQQKGFMFFSATAIALCSSMALVYFQNREKFIAFIINMPNYLTIPVIALASLITISVMIFTIKQFKNTEEYQIRKGDDHKILNATLDHQKENKIIKSMELKYSNNTISEFAFNVWKSNDGFVDIDRKAITRTGKVESLINNRPLFTFLFTNFIAANVALPSALYAIGGVNNVKAFYAVLPTTYIGLSIIVASNVLALSILYLGSHYYNKTNCTNLVCTQDNIEPKIINDKIIDTIKEKRTNVLQSNHEKEAKSCSLELKQVVVQSHNHKVMIYNILN